MFTGIIQDIGKVISVEQRGDLRLQIQTNFDLNDTALGASIACNGCCLTVVEKGPDHFGVEVSAESVSKTTIGLWDKGYEINLERAVRVGDELGGHIVSGHVDDLAEVHAITVEGDSHKMIFWVPAHLKRYIAEKGSVALNGVSLTVNQVENDLFAVNIIPHTWNHTTFKNLKAGDKVHLEIDMLARYVARMLECK